MMNIFYRVEGWFANLSRCGRCRTFGLNRGAWIYQQWPSMSICPGCITPDESATVNAYYAGAPDEVLA